MAAPDPRRGAPTWVALSLVALLLLGLAIATGGGEDAGEDARAGGAGAGAGAAAAAPRPRAAAAVSPEVRAAAGALPPAAQVAQLFLVDTEGRVPRRRDWGALQTGPAGPPAALRRALRRARRAVRPLIAAKGLPRQPALARRGAARASRAYRSAAAKLRRAGVSLGLGLSLDLATEVGPLAGESFSDEPTAVAALGTAALAGAARARLALAAGRFPGQGAASQDPIDGPAVVGLSRARLAQRDLVPFRAVAGRAPVIVVSSALYTAYDPTTPAARSPALVAGVLRERLGFRGVAMTDRLTGLAVVGGGGPGDAAVGALRAGVDLVWAGDEREAEAGRAAVLAALRGRRLPAARVREALERVLELKRGAGLL